MQLVWHSVRSYQVTPAPLDIRSTATSMRVKGSSARATLGKVAGKSNGTAWEHVYTCFRGFRNRVVVCGECGHRKSAPQTHSTIAPHCPTAPLNRSLKSHTSTGNIFDVDLSGLQLLLELLFHGSLLRCLAHETCLCCLCLRQQCVRAAAAAAAAPPPPPTACQPNMPEQC